MMNVQYLQKVQLVFDKWQYDGTILSTYEFKMLAAWLVLGCF